MEENDHLWCARPQLFCGENLDCLVLHAAPGAWDRRPSGTQRLSPWHNSAAQTSHLVPGEGWGKGSRYKAHSAWALLHDISLRQKPGLKKIINKREPPTRLQEHQQRRRLLKLWKKSSCRFAGRLLPTGTLLWASKIRICQNSALARATLVIQLDLNWNIWCLLICSNKFTRSWLCSGN